MRDVDDLVTWLRAQIDEDERVARKAGEAMGFDDPSFPDYRTYDGWELEAADAFIARLTPARVLREVEAKRRIIDAWEDPANVEHLPEGVHDGRDPDERDRDVAVAEAIDEVVRLLALPYADRPGYREEWKP